MFCDSLVCKVFRVSDTALKMSVASYIFQTATVKKTTKKNFLFS